ncbi:MAG TPA: TIGR03986 family CRISPR-associated RAMP protein, partial [Firmicutes bacterium]|nr:TIGR03986 family CRISPR-associated RAMP protein [Bacillota bacterium]
MEKAKLINIRRSKKGKMVGTVKFIDGKTMQIPAGALFDESLNDSECEVERDVTGSIILIMVNGKEIYKTAKSVTRGKKETVRQKVRVGNHDSRRTTFQTAATSSAQEATAHAPYNFIPLNKIVVPGQERP